MYSVFREKRHFFRVLNSVYNHKCPTRLQQERLGEGRKSTQCSNCFISPGHRGEACKALEWRGQWRPSFASNAYRHRCSAMPCSAFRVHNSKKVAFSGQFAVRTVHNSILLAHAPESPTLRSHTGPPACRSPAYKPSTSKRFTRASWCTANCKAVSLSTRPSLTSANRL